jgi:hypothetical protein
MPVKKVNLPKPQPRKPKAIHTVLVEHKEKKDKERKEKEEKKKDKENKLSTEPL